MTSIKGAEKFIICCKKFVSASNERHSSGDTGTILEYTNVTGPNQSVHPGTEVDEPLTPVIVGLPSPPGTGRYSFKI